MIELTIKNNKPHIDISNITIIQYVKKEISTIEVTDGWSQLATLSMNNVYTIANPKPMYFIKQAILSFKFHFKQWVEVK